MDLLCIGNALVDVFAEVEGDFQAVFGLPLPVQHLEHGQVNDILGLLNEFSISAGGGAANVAKIAAILGLSTGFIGALGSQLGKEPPAPDHFAHLFEEELAAAGVELRLSRSQRPTGIFLLLQNNQGERRIAVAPSAALELNEEDISEDSIRESRVAVLDGYLLDREALVRRVLNTAACYGTAVALDLGSEDMARNRAEQIAAYCRDYPLILFMNEGEAEAFYEALGSPGAEDSEEPGEAPLAGERRKDAPRFRRLCSFFQSLTAGDLYPIIVVKRGPRGALAFAGGDIHRAETLPIVPLETTGAGDAFCAAFLAGWVRDRSLAECAALGNRVAREVLDAPGTKIDRKKLAQAAKSLLH